ncbi:MAG: hypothetical protein NVV68_06985 [Dokdonella sp.]|nr:hypothetical protein [Dokdonella sp.]
MSTLTELVRSAAALAQGGAIACASNGHLWESDGGRACPKGSANCSQTVYLCERCGAYDYGDPGGPAHEECSLTCALRR